MPILEFGWAVLNAFLRLECVYSRDRVRPYPFLLYASTSFPRHTVAAKHT